jgi:catechol 2,3-dioxygenase-like lactoylglutathione lyase family enzyme
MITGIHHSGIGVRDMETSLHFYRDLLGLEVTGDAEVEGPMVDAIVGLESARVRIVHLKCAENQEIELFQYYAPTTSSFTKDFKQSDGGIIHLALFVDDLMKNYERLKESGVKFNSQPYNLGGTLAVYMRDPDGITIELMQRDFEE